MKYREETFTQVIVDIVPLLAKHWDEVARNKDKIPFDPNYIKYKELYDQGILNIFTAREDDNTLSGYCITLTTPHIHYWSTIMSNVDILYVDKKHRGSMTGYRLMKYTENKLKEKGVAVLMHHVKDSHDFSPLLRRMGYEKHETIYGKYIKD